MPQLSDHQNSSTMPDPAPSRLSPAAASRSIASADMDLNQLEAFLTAQTKKQGGITSDQAAVIAKFWKNHRIKIHESLINQSRWDNVLKNMNWRVDLKSQSRHIDQINTPVAIVEMELGKNGQHSLITLDACFPATQGLGMVSENVNSGEMNGTAWVLVCSPS
ncbi:COMM domain-containing protein 1 isoform X2 [Egretta garzetta]|uniref:COMM domain-containing protein 1 isoform X2 n=1 Tax=Egretta garzetta TaxID=188379 RepID=UPI00163D2D61|nr:COMM domain-containing protein 1 isoform X2 [Egretta garzetta]